VRQVVGDHDVTVVGGNREIARVDAGADFGDQLEIVNVVFTDPAIARCEVNEAAVRGILGPAVQGEAGLEAMDRFEAVAVQQGNVVVAQLDDQEQVEQVIHLEHRFVGQILDAVMDDAAGVDLGQTPGKRFVRRGVDIFDQRFDLRFAELIRERRHLCGDAAIADHLQRGRLAQALEVAGKQCRPHAAQAFGVVALRTVLLVQRLCIRRPRTSGRKQQAEKSKGEICAQHGRGPARRGVAIRRR